METCSNYFDSHRCLSQSEESKCMWTHGKDGVTRHSQRSSSIRREHAVKVAPSLLCVHIHLSLSGWERHLWVLKSRSSVPVFPFGLFVPFIGRPVQFFSKNFS